MALERETMVRVALVPLNDVGLDGLTVRRLAERLGVQNPALYWHFKNKQDLLDEMAKTMVADAFAELEPPAIHEQWADWLAEVAERFHLTLLAHRDGARVIAAADLTESALLGIQELALSVLTTAGFDLRTALMCIVAIFDYTLGAAFEEQSESDHPKWGRSNLFESRRPSLDPVRLPLLAAAFDELTNTTTDRPNIGFKGGIHLLLAGMVATKKTPTT
ncbi:MAG TPA: TetR/AcrR family transcriptional regulator C-terminal domain-containing protein [Ktedonobacteraceae bacterium]|jgi:TetR/AcrR family tetracycline transcriptional repressor|nr:TetR/AcrR family transcriptional regulator C-terminal domain-containing protein [Ktedonobacteraceae bacterium]